MANYDVNKVLEVAKDEIGYLEKKSNSQLDNKTANAGEANYTKYARDYKTWTGVDFQAQPWCAMAASWFFVKAYGLSAAKELLCGSLWAYCPYIVNTFKAKNQWYATPKVGDLILFGSSTGVASHVGIVVGVSNGIVTTIEGNTSGASGVIANGGGVCKKYYNIGYSRILGYARPKYSEQSVNSNAYVDFVKAVQKACGATVDGIAGRETLSKTVTVSVNVNRRHIVVKAIQNYLIAIGYSLPKYGADGDFGAETKAAVVKFQTQNWCISDGEITAGKLTWKKLLKLA